MVKIIYNSSSKKIRIANSVVGLITGIYLLDSLLPYILPTIDASTGFNLLFSSFSYYAFGGILFSLIFYLLSPTFINSSWHLVAKPVFTDYGKFILVDNELFTEAA